MDELLKWSPLFAVALSALALWRAISGERSKETNTRFDELEDLVGDKADLTRVQVLEAKLDIVDDKVMLVQNDLKHLPDKDVTHRLEVALGKMGAELGKLSAKVEPIAHMANRMQDVLMEKVMEK